MFGGTDIDSFQGQEIRLFGAAEAGGNARGADAVASQRACCNAETERSWAARVSARTASAEACSAGSRCSANATSTPVTTTTSANSSRATPRPRCRGGTGTVLQERKAGLHGHPMGEEVGIA